METKKNASTGKRNLGQPLTPEEEKAWLPNLHLELTQKAEIKRLNKVIEEKNDCISKFQTYDKKRTEEFHRLKQNVAIMEERFNAFNAALGDCDGLSKADRDIIMSLYKRWFKQLMAFDHRIGDENKLKSRINDLRNDIQSLFNIIEQVQDIQVFTTLAKRIDKMYGHVTEMKAVLDGKLTVNDNE